MSRAVLLHYHIFKNAGSSLDALLSEGLGEAWVPWDPGDQPDEVYGPRDVIPYIRENVHVRALSSHKLRPPTPVLETVRIFPLLFVRHPVLRAPSIYKYDASLEGETERQRVARSGSFREYVAWCFDAAIVPIFQDFQTAYLSGEQLRYENPTSVRVRRPTFLRAVDFLESLDVFGIVERFNDSMERFHQRFGAAFPEVQWRETHENVSRPGLSTLDEIRLELGDRLYERLLEANRLDLALYEHAVKLFDSGRRN